MNKTLVIYSSKYGHTKKYAEWLAEDLNADICDDKNLKKEMLNSYSVILFGSSLYAGKNKSALLIVKYVDFTDRKMILPIVEYCLHR